MTLNKLFALSLCLSLSAAFVAGHPLESPAVSSTISSDDPRQDTAIFNVLATHDEAYPEPFELKFQVLEPQEDTPCGSSHFSVNDHEVHARWSNTDGNWSTSASFAVNTFHHTAGWRSLQVLVDTVCAPSPVNNKRRISAPSNEAKSSALQVASLRLSHINGESARSFAGFTVAYDQSERAITATDDVPTSSLLWPVREIAAQSTSSSTLETTQQLVSEEISKLRDLEADFASFASVIEKQRVLVGDLTRENSSSGREALQKCGRDIACLATTLVSNAKSCAHVLYAKYGPRPAKAVTGSGRDCVLPTTRDERIDAIVYNRPICANQPATSNGLAPGSTSGSDASAGPLPAFLDTTHYFHTLLALVAAFICLTCLTTYLHRKCCSPRARAERAARREERRVRREYRCLARKKAWSDWWETRLRCNTRPASTDYEEKRAMILQQESILEAAMQQEIVELANAHGLVTDMVRAAEEGHASTHAEASDPLPAYRSRAGSNVTGRSLGRPPSYREIDPILHPEMRQYSNFARSNCGTDVTPDSSIADLSPRQSSETLRTERSAF